MSTATPKPPDSRMVTREGRPNVVQLGLESRPLQDAYFLLLTTSWTRLLVLAVALYLVVNSGFAVLYMWTGGIDNARPGSFADRKSVV